MFFDLNSVNTQMGKLGNFNQITSKTAEDLKGFIPLFSKNLQRADSESIRKLKELKAKIESLKTIAEQELASYRKGSLLAIFRIFTSSAYRGGRSSASEIKGACEKIDKQINDVVGKALLSDFSASFFQDAEALVNLNVVLSCMKTSHVVISQECNKRIKTFIDALSESQKEEIKKRYESVLLAHGLESVKESVSRIKDKPFTEQTYELVRSLVTAFFYSGGKISGEDRASLIDLFNQSQEKKSLFFTSSPANKVFKELSKIFEINNETATILEPNEDKADRCPEGINQEDWVRFCLKEESARNVRLNSIISLGEIFQEKYDEDLVKKDLRCKINEGKTIVKTKGKEGNFAEAVDQKKFKAGIAATTGYEDRIREKNIMEDRYLVDTLECGTKMIPVAAVFDGHGDLGHLAADFVKEAISKKIQEKFNAFTDEAWTDENIEIALTLATLEVEAAWKARQKELSGTTMTLNLIIDEHVWCVNVGDSRTCLLHETEGKQLSRDASLDYDKFSKGVLSRGGKIIERNQKRRVNGCLAMARSIEGDHGYSKGVTALPTITKTVIKDGDYLLIGSDGLYDECESKDLLKYLKGSQKELRDIAIDLVCLAVNRSLKKFGDADNTTGDCKLNCVIDL